MNARFIRGFSAVAASASLFVVNNAYAKKPVELNAQEFEGKVVLEGQGVAISSVTAAPRVISDVDYRVDPGTPEQMARQYLSENAKSLSMKAGAADLVFDGAVLTPGGVHAHFHQKSGTMDVVGSDTNVTIDHRHHVTFVMSGYRPQAENVANQLLLSQSHAITRASRYLSMTASDAKKETDSVVFIDQNGNARIAHRVRVSSPKEHLWAWEVLVDSETGEVLRAKDQVTHAKGTVFDPNPVIKTGMVWAEGNQLNDAVEQATSVKSPNCSDSAWFDSQLTPVALEYLNPPVNAKFDLIGKYAASVDAEPPTNPDCTQNSDDFSMTREKPCFDMVNAYYFITKQLKYINEELGYKVMPIKYQGGQHFDAHGVDGDDNSHFDPTTGTLAFGEGGVPDSQDHDVVLHELGHMIHDSITNGNLSQQDGLSEGIADYFANSYARQFMSSTHPAYFWTFSFDGHNQFWPGRVTNDTLHYPDQLPGEIHADGELWASAMGEVYVEIGKNASDRIMLEGMSMLNGTANQNDTANAVLKADKKLFEGSHVAAITKVFQTRGYTIQ